jgi:hypothetical protein
MKRKISVVITLCLLSLTTATVLAQSGGSYDLTWSSLNGGGGEASGGSWALISTVGQGEAGALHGGSYTLSGGFLAGMSSPPPANDRVYLPVILR